jgi:hypothetical protein
VELQPVDSAISRRRVQTDPPPRKPLTTTFHTVCLICAQSTLLGLRSCIAKPGFMELAWLLSHMLGHGFGDRLNDGPNSTDIAVILVHSEPKVRYRRRYWRII